MIIKPTNEEAKLLDRALSYIAQYVDEICITQAGKEKNKEVSSIIKKYNAKESFFQWNNSFADARNFNFDKTTGDYIFWIDADDVVRGAEHLRQIVEKMEEQKVDTVIMHYLYHFNEHGLCDTKHQKVRIIKKGSVKWIGEIHEDFHHLREIKQFFVEEMEILHLSDEKRVEESSKRNLEIAEEFVKKYPKDARGQWLLGNAYFQEKRYKEAEEQFKKFVHISGSQEEIYLAYINLGLVTGNEDYFLKAIAIRPQYPDAYIQLGKYYKDKGRLEQAKQFIIEGLKKPIPEMQIVVYDPREYDLKPMMMLANIYIEMNEYSKALICLKRCAKIDPKDEQVKKIIPIIEKGEAFEKKVEEASKKILNIKDMVKLKRYFDNLEMEVRAHPKICTAYNIYFKKETSSGKDIAYFCGYNSTPWNPRIAEEKGVGGSEEAVINLAKRWAKQGYNVDVFCNTNLPKPEVFEGVTYKPWWMYNVRDKYDAVVMWRHPKMMDYEINSDNVFVDMHDVMPSTEFTPERLEKIKKVFVKTKSHRVLFPNVPDEKIAIVPNGIEPELFEEKIEKNPYLILNTSSPDRHIDATLDVFEELIKRQPDKPWKLAWYYGWKNYVDFRQDDPEAMEYYKIQSERFNKLVKEGRAEGGTMISHKEIARKYLEAGIFFYPTQFYEIHCISAVKAQLAGCYSVTSDAFALNETIQYGTKINTDSKRWYDGEKTFGDVQIDKYIEALSIGEERELEIEGEREWAKENFNWDKISNEWLKLLGI